MKGYKKHAKMEEERISSRKLSTHKKSKIVVNPPGPKSKQMIREYDEVISGIYVKYFPLVMEEAEGSIVRDVDGNIYIDLTGGNRADSIGYQHKKVLKALEKQAKKLMHVQPNIGYHPLWTELGKHVQKILPGILREGKFVFLNSGSEAIDAGMKLARYVSGRQKFVAFYGSFHGRTYGATSLSTGHYKKGYLPLVPGVVFTPFPYCYRCHFGKEYPHCKLHCLDALEEFLKLNNPEEVAAIVLEPIQGVGGILVPPAEYLPMVRKICDKNNILMIADEIETGFGVTGKVFAVEHWGIAPDILAIGKAFGGGLPLSAVVARKQIMDQWPPGAHGTTTGGGLLACAAAIEVVNIVKDQIDGVKVLGSYMMKRLESLRQDNDLIGEVRGKGLFIGIELVEDPRSKKPATKQTQKIILKAFKRGVLFSSCGLHKNVIRIMAPTCLTRKQAEKSLDILEEVLAHG